MCASTDWWNTIWISIRHPPSSEGFADRTVATPRATAGEFDIATTFEVTINATPNQEIVLESSTFGSVFTDLFAAEDPDTWSASIPDTTVIAITSSDPAVRFQLVPDPPQPDNRRPATIIDWQRTNRTPTSSTYAIVWTSTADASYRIDSSTDGRTWAPISGKESIASQGTQTASDLAFDTQNNPKILVRVVAN